jgi:hypothetical protein
MTTLPASDWRYAHAELLDNLAQAARVNFAALPLGVWNPSRNDSATDVGRGILDAFALALHVLWTYQEAWAAEGFLTTAALDGSTDRLLAGVGYVLSPGAAAVGFQQFSCKAGVTATLPQGFAVKSPASGDEPDAIFETLAPLDLHPELNEVPVFWPPAGSTPVAPPGDVGSGIQPPPPTNPLFPAGSLADSLYGALQAERSGQAAARAAAQARSQAQQLSDMMNIVQRAADSGAKVDMNALRSALQPVCEQLCAAQSAAVPPPATGAPGVITESQEILARQLKLLRDRRSTALADLEQAMIQGFGAGLVPRVDVTDGACNYANVVFLKGQASDLARFTFATNPLDPSTIWSVDGSSTTTTGASFTPSSKPPLVMPTTAGKHVLGVSSQSGSRSITIEVTSGPLRIGIGTDEDDDAYAARLAALARFLDALVASLIQDARDQVVLMHGIDALGRLDQAFGDTQATPQGSASANQSALFLLAPGPTPGSTQTLPMIRPGDWFILAEAVDQTDPKGNTTTVRQYRQALRVRSAFDARPTPTSTPLTEILFDPPLTQGYADLSRVVLLGNVVPVSMGSSVQETVQPSPDGRTVALSRSPLTWLRDPAAPSGRTPQVDLLVNGRPWTRVPNLLDPTMGPASYAVETSSDGVILRTSDGFEGVALPNLPIQVRYRVGVGATGNRAGLRLNATASSHPAVQSTMNPLPTAGGTDPEPRSQARTRGPLAVAATDRAVSVADVQALALAFDGVLRARAFLQGTPRRAKVVVVVAGPDDTALGDTDRQNLLAYLAARVPPGVQIDVENRILVPVRASIQLRRLRSADPTQIARAVRVRLGIDRDPASPPGLLDAQTVDLQADLRLSAVYGALQGIDGLDSLLVQKLYRSDGPARLYQRIQAGPYELLTWDRPDDGTEGLALDDEEA